jgi:2,5-diketo-D-gluconate reductase B
MTYVPGQPHKWGLSFDINMQPGPNGRPAGSSQAKMLDCVRGKGIPLTAYALLAQGRAAHDETLQRIGTKHGVSAAQIAIAWLLDQPGVIAIPKAQQESSQRSNLEALKIKLDDEDRAEIAALPKDQRYVKPPFAPDWNAYENRHRREADTS